MNKAKYIKIFAPLAVIIVLAGGVYLYYWWGQASNPNYLNKTYQVSDFPNSENPAESKQRLVDQLNKTVVGLRDNTIDSQYSGWIDVGNLKFAMKDYVGAEAAYNQALAIDDKAPLAYLNMGTLYKMGIQDFPKSESYYLKAMERIGSPFYSDYESFADLYVNYWKDKDVDIESIMMMGADKTSEPTQKLPYYVYLYRYFRDNTNQTKADEYSVKILTIDPKFELPTY